MLLVAPVESHCSAQLACCAPGAYLARLESPSDYGFFAFTQSTSPKMPLHSGTHQLGIFGIQLLLHLSKPLLKDRVLEACPLPNIQQTVLEIGHKVVPLRLHFAELPFQLRCGKGWVTGQYSVGVLSGPWHSVWGPRSSVWRLYHVRGVHEVCAQGTQVCGDLQWGRAISRGMPLH